MKRFKTVFRKPDTSDHASPRRLWRRSAVKPQPEATTTETGEDQVAVAGPSSEQNKPETASTVAPVGDDAGDDVGDDTPQPDPNPQPEATGELNRSRFGTQRLKKLVTRLRLSGSGEEEPITQPSEPSQPETGDSTAPREQAAGGPLSSNPFESPPGYENIIAVTASGSGSREDARNAGNRGSHSRESSQTEGVCEHPPDCPHIPESRIRMSLDEEVEDWMWPGLMYIPEEGTRIREYSDPFSDGKSNEYRQLNPDKRPVLPGPASGPMPGPSRRSPFSSQDEVRPCEGPLEPIPETEADTLDQIDRIDQIVATEAPQRTPSQIIPGRPRARAISAGSNSSHNSTVAMTPQTAIVNFNRMAAQQGIHVGISPDEIASPPLESIASEEEETSRRGMFSRLRKVRSNLETPPETERIPILRRIRTFGSIRPDPLTSLNGRTLEDLARLGGHSFIVNYDLSPGPLQLPACMVSALLFLYRHGVNQIGLFTDPGDLKAATRTYESWAKDVFDAEKIQGEIDLTTRVVAMPRVRDDATQVLSVGWALKALLAGLPRGILGSARLYHTLHNLFAITIPENTGFKIPSHFRGVTASVAVRVQLISLALIGLSSEMQRDLICAIFGLLTFLLRPESTLGRHGSQRSQGSRSPGIELRQPISPPEYHEMVRFVAPMLLGPQNRPRVLPGVEQVEQEFEEGRVAGLLLDHWPNVHRQLQNWLRDTYVP
ncbi:unnamed protein product [Penicillium salamii]|uniref:Rho-GAP domain-containing protein n=1 Tax=Penicillium salamii TaxID=1612424 RepID=A0A9W4IZE5_9EURO|nr:unnamed protein product [Penicillium salamii]CAG8021729.1 unnamed protein product [Penicillium salamii]CAG8129046.1 unnamed protein product [Penicillium salamii]CAG8303360.1 unnamed protein product [Penicillium salamii]CAG8322378.1 unnamed protein product [Penicillium salamii]